MKKIIYILLSFTFIYSLAFSANAARELSLGCFEGYAEQEWIDVGMAEDKCEGGVGQPTCHTNAQARETRIDYMIANAQLMFAITKCRVDNTSCFPTHRPLMIDWPLSTSDATDA